MLFYSVIDLGGLFNYHFFICCARDQTQSLGHTRATALTLNYNPSPLIFEGKFYCVWVAQVSLEFTVQPQIALTLSILHLLPPACSDDRHVAPRLTHSQNVVNILIQGFLWKPIFISLRLIPRIRISGSQDRCIFNF